MNTVPVRPRMRAAARRNQGAAMLAVMLILLVATATAAISVRSTGTEMRATGHDRRVMQGKLISEAGLAVTISRLDALGGATVEASFKQLEANGIRPYNPDDPDGATLADNGFNEPKCTYPGDNGCNRFDHYFSDPDATDFTTPAFNSSPMPIDVLGTNQAYRPWFAVDLRYVEDSTQPLPGYRAEGGGTMKFIRVDLVARGGTQFVADGEDEARTINASCASVTLGPIMSF